MRMMSEVFFLVSKIISVSILFFLTFCEKIFKLCLIISRIACSQTNCVSPDFSGFLSFL